MVNAEKIPNHGKKPNQKMKPYMVLQYLLKYTDEDHVVASAEIIGFLEECGLSAERRSIYRDIEEINKAALMLDEDCSLEVAEEMLSGDDADELRLVVYDKNRKGYYVRQRNYDVNDIQLLAECIYSAKFISQGQADRLVNVVCGFVSEHQADKIRHHAFLTDRVKTNNKQVLFNIALINEAMSRTFEGRPHIPEKISFKYLRYSINDLGQQVERRQGAKYVVSPFKLLINEGNYYLLAFDDNKQEMRTYRVDRMKDVALLGLPRDGEKAYAAIDLKTYTKRVFGMFGGKDTSVTIRFINPLLDAVVERFGTDKGTVLYNKVDEHHFSVTTHVEISDQFYGWLLGFGKKAKLTGSVEAVEQFKEFLDKVREMY